jgi:sugar lactone lactonase YvrE
VKGLRPAAAVLGSLALAAGAGAVSGTGTIYPFAGTGAGGYSGDGGKATAAALSAPTGVVLDGAGNLYVADSGNHRIRKITPAGVITTIAGTGSAGFSGDGGPATSAQLFSPSALAFDGAGNLYVADTGNNRVRRIGTDGRITTVAGTGVADQSPEGTPALEADLNVPLGVAVDRSGRLYIVEEDRVLTIAADGTIRTVAGALYSSGYNGDNVAASSALLDSPTGIAVDGAGNVYVSDTDNQRIRKVGTDGIIRTIAGTGAEGFGGDGGPATAAQLGSPYGLAVGPDGAVYVADHGNHRVRKILPDGTIITVAGGGENGVRVGPARNAELVEPVGLAVDASGGLLVTDRSANRVYRVADLTAELGTVSRAWVSATRSGSPKKRLSTESREFWAHFSFAEQPAPGLPIVVEFYSPRNTKLGSVAKARAARIDVVLRRQKQNALFAAGRWRVVLRVAGKPVKTITFRVEAFEIK